MEKVVECFITRRINIKKLDYSLKTSYYSELGPYGARIELTVNEPNTMFLDVLSNGVIERLYLGINNSTNIEIRGSEY